jgi:azurin
MRRRDLLAGLLLTPAGFFGYRALAASGHRPQVNLTVATDGDLLAFKPVELTCPTGAHVHLTFSHTGKYIRQDHDWVLTLPGASDAVDKAALAAGEDAQYLPPKADKQVIAMTPMCGKGEQVSVDFIAPAPGDYPFICTYPGHAAFMHGVLHVTR